MCNLVQSYTSVLLLPTVGMGMDLVKRFGPPALLALYRAVRNGREPCQPCFFDLVPASFAPSELLTLIIYDPH